MTVEEMEQLKRALEYKCNQGIETKEDRIKLAELIDKLKEGE